MSFAKMDNGGRNIKLYQAEFIDTGQLKGDCYSVKSLLIEWLKHLSKNEIVKETGDVQYSLAQC